MYFRILPMVVCNLVSIKIIIIIIIVIVIIINIREFGSYIMFIIINSCYAFDSSHFIFGKKIIY